ncbi:MAG: monofunctional biosynthetic peptidoglycan transglycosylase [Rhizobiales bacterium]|nr:monofunctional biosynthetic peptidoglycan transglycosylase [Hyphomicrobiales bacterium]
MRLLWRWLKRVTAIVVVGITISLLWGRFLPLPSTLMLGRWVSGQDVERRWVNLRHVSSYLPRAIIASEDQRFCNHWGIDFVELRGVLADRAGPARGASTITMQVAKNIYLWPGRSVLRKAIELPLALVIDLAWGKHRVMEVYLNVAEWGDGLFGAEAAARHYFSKSARDLSATEAARLVAVLPNPSLRDASQPSVASRRILARMAEVSDLTGCVSP